MFLNFFLLLTLRVL